MRRAQQNDVSSDDTAQKTKCAFIVNTLQFKLCTMVVIALLGASGPSGQEVIKEAMNRGISVRAVVRSPTKISVEDLKLQVGGALPFDELTEST